MSVEPSEAGLDGRADEVGSHAIVEGGAVDAERVVDDLDRPVDVVVAVGVADDERGRDHAAPDQLLHEERDRKSTRLNSSHVKISYAVFCLKKKNLIDATVVVLAVAS